MRGMCRDPIKEVIWVFTSKAVYKYKVVREARYISCIVVLILFLLIIQCNLDLFPWFLLFQIVFLLWVYWVIWGRKSSVGLIMLQMFFFFTGMFGKCTWNEMNSVLQRHLLLWDEILLFLSEYFYIKIYYAVESYYIWLLEPLYGLFFLCNQSPQRMSSF